MPKSRLQKQKEAEDRAKIRAKRSPKDQIARLDSKFGTGVAATRERKRLLTTTTQPSGEAKNKRTKKIRDSKDRSPEVRTESP